MFEVLSDLPEYRQALRASNEQAEETFDAKQLFEFLTSVQMVMPLFREA